MLEIVVSLCVCLCPSQRLEYMTNKWHTDGKIQNLLIYNVEKNKTQTSAYK